MEKKRRHIIFDCKMITQINLIMNLWKKNKLTDREAIEKIDRVTSKGVTSE